MNIRNVERVLSVILSERHHAVITVTLKKTPNRVELKKVSNKKIKNSCIIC